MVVELERFSSYAVFGVKKAFTDTASHWAKEDVELLAARGLVEGVGPGVFAPNRALTRAEAAALLARFKGLEPAEPALPTFGDVRPGAWYYGAVEAAVRAGLLKGFGDGTFRPDATLTREQLAVVLAGLLGKTEIPVPELPFVDAAQVSPWAREAVKLVCARGLMRGVSPERFAPKAEVTRAEIAACLVRLAERMGLFEVTAAVTGKLVLSTVEKPHWELEAEGRTYVLLTDPADKVTAAFLRAHEGRRVTVTGYLLPGADIYMRGPLLKVLEVAPAE